MTMTERKVIKAMAELMGSCGGRIDAGTQECVTHDRSYGTRTEKAPERSFGA